MTKYLIDGEELTFNQMIDLEVVKSEELIKRINNYGWLKNIILNGINKRDFSYGFLAGVIHMIKINKGEIIELKS